MDQVVRIIEWRVPSAHEDCDRFTNYPYKISMSKFCMGDAMMDF